MNENQLAKTVHARSVLKATKGRFAKVVYTNGKGERKAYTVRTGVKKHLTTPIEPNYKPSSVDGPIKVYSVTSGNKGYKSFLPERIESITCGGISYKM